MKQKILVCLNRSA